MTGWGGLKPVMPIACVRWGEVAGSKEREQVSSERWVAAEWFSTEFSDCTYICSFI